MRLRRGVEGTPRSGGPSFLPRPILSVRCRRRRGLFVLVNRRIGYSIWACISLFTITSLSFRT